MQRCLVVARAFFRPVDEYAGRGTVGGAGQSDGLPHHRLVSRIVGVDLAVIVVDGLLQVVAAALESRLAEWP